MVYKLMRFFSMQPYIYAVKSGDGSFPSLLFYTHPIILINNKIKPNKHYKNNYIDNNIKY